MEKESQNWRKQQKKFYNSRLWNVVREQVIIRDKNICQVCKKFIRKGKTYVHHIEELNPQNIDDPSVALNKKNLITVCHKCHEDFHPDRFGRKKKEKECIVDDCLNIDYSKRRKEVE